VLVDHRELNGPLARLVRREGVALEPRTLPVGDLILSNRVAVERKEAGDFCRSILDGRLMEQARLLKRNFEAPILLIEGDPEEARGGIRKEAVPARSPR
jgi:Fanconi anemia group M protein